MQEQAAKPVILDSTSFDREVLESPIPVLVDFWAAWCPPCRAVAPALEELAGELAGTAKIAKLDVDAEPDLAARFGIHSIPTLLVFHGGRIVDRIVGAAPKSAIADRLRRLPAT